MTYSVQKLWNQSIVTGMEMTDDAPNQIDKECKVCLKDKTT